MPTQPASRILFFRNATLLVSSMLTVMAGAAIAPALPEMSLAFQQIPNASLWVKLVMTIPALFIGIGAPGVGILLDRWGRKTVLCLALLLYSLAGSLGYLMDTLPALLISRCVLGLAVAGTMTSTVTLIGDFFKGQELNRFMGLQSMFMGIGGILFMLSGGFLASINWHMPFLVYLFGLVPLAGAVFFMPEPQRTAPSSAATALRLSGLPWKKMLLIYGISFIGMTVFYMMPVQFPFYMDAFYHANSSQVGMTIAFMNVFSALSSLAFAPLRARTSPAIIAIFIYLSLGVGMVTFFFAHSLLMIVPGLVLTGVGIGWLIPNMNGWIVSIAPADFRGRAVGGLTTFFYLGQFFSPLLVAPLLQRIALDGVYGLVGVGMIALAALAVLAVAAFPRRVMARK